MEKVDLRKINKIHFTGIKGVGMTALACCAHDLGIKVSGSDVKEYFVTDETLKEAGISWRAGFKKSHVGQPDLLVFTAAHQGEENIEVKEAKAKGVPVLSHAQALGVFMQNKIGISVCGVGGKTTTSSIIATIFSTARFKPSFAIGVGRIDPLGLPGRYISSGRHFVAEADEYFASPQDQTPRFYYQDPQATIVTNLEFDHPDVYQDLDHTTRVFKKFIEKTPKNGIIVVGIDNPRNQRLIDLLDRPVVSYGFSPQADWRITSINQSKEEVSFSLEYKGLIVDDLTIQLPGRFNLLNATAGLVVANFFGISFEKIKQGLAAFKGTKRRFERIGEFEGIRLYDDYGHHPSQLRATLAASQQWFKEARIIAVFQPHTYSRTKALLEEFSHSFTQADLVVITDIYASAREEADRQVSGRLLAQKIGQIQKNVYFKSGRQEVADFLASQARPGDVIFTFGAGDIFNWHPTIIEAINKKKQ